MKDNTKNPNSSERKTKEETQSKEPFTSDFKLIVSEHVEKLIRKYCNLLPSNEWSGVLFYTAKGGFETKDLTLTCQDFLLMDIGTHVHTQFNYDNPDVAYYMATHPELVDCKMGILH